MSQSNEQIQRARMGLTTGATYSVTRHAAMNRPASTFTGVYVKPMRGGVTQVFTSTASGFVVQVASDLIVSVEEVGK